MTDSQTVAVRLRIHGRVQGVYFRAWTCEKAEKLGVRGWVRNRSDGTVEALLAGPAEAVEAMVTRCAEGPPAASVARIERDSEDPAAHDLSGFRQLPTA